MVMPQFPKCMDVKNTVCLAALVVGIGAYMHTISMALKVKISPETKTHVYLL
jgi:hypothetical protein